MGLVDKCIEAAQECKDSRCPDILLKAERLQQMLIMGPSETDDCQYFNDLLDLAPKSLDILKRKAECNLDKGFAIEALTDLMQVVQIDPADTKTTAEVAVASYLLLDQSKQALQILRRCASFNEDAADYCGPTNHEDQNHWIDL
ncbi:hypothetical protein FF38_01122 [Lucilia cuprina]|uniref:Uncharacterized protein n=1 Tax=Lucilia cuprina TaxID=7375 RepID=A0A0L0CTJ7_LUCCU|nr:hypothetical protein FF38_01122 [Lucilia cuprina]